MKQLTHKQVIDSKLPQSVVDGLRAEIVSKFLNDKHWSWSIENFHARQESANDDFEQWWPNEVHDMNKLFWKVWCHSDDKTNSYKSLYMKSASATYLWMYFFGSHRCWWNISVNIILTFVDEWMNEWNCEWMYMKPVSESICTWALWIDFIWVVI